MRPSSSNFTRAALPLLFALAVPCANAGILYSTGFESPAFTAAPTSGQDGWNVYGSGLTAISDTFAKSGTQSVFVDGGTVDQSGPYHGDNSVGPFVRLSADLAVFTSTTQSEWQFAGLGPGLAGFLGGIDIFPDNSIVAITAGFPTIGVFSRATGFDATAWHHVELLFNIPAQIYDITIDGVTLATGVAFCGDNDVCAGAPVGTYGSVFFDSFGADGLANDSGYMDNLVVAESNAPEPSSVLLIAGGLGAMLLRLRRKAA